MKKFIIIVLSIFIVSTVPAFSEVFAPVGTSTGQFLTIGVGGREVAMGEAVTALTEGSGSVFWNPSGVVDASGHDLYAAYNPWPAGIHVGAFSYAYKHQSWGTFAANVRYLNFGEMEITTVQDPNGTGQMLQMSNYALGLTYGRYLTDRVSMGLTAKLVHEKYGNNGYSTVAWDIGIIYRAPFKNLKIGMSILNFSNKVQYSGTYIDYSNSKSYLTNTELSFDEWSLPMTFRFGAVIDVYDKGANKLIAAMDMIHPNDNREQYNIGLEYAYDQTVFFRAGYKLTADTGGFSTGLGLKWNNIVLDYALCSMGDLGLTNRLSLGFEF